MDLQKLQTKYTGEVAENYEDIRVGEKWERENRIVEEFLTQATNGNGELVLDVPVGTGRFFDVYRRAGVRVSGYDISEDMITEAKAKVEDDDEIDLKGKGFFEIDMDVNPDVLVSIRFLRWLDRSDVNRFFVRLKEMGIPTVIVGVRYLEKAISKERSVGGNATGIFGEVTRLLKTSVGSMKTDGVGSVVKKGWFYIYSRLKSVLGYERQNVSITRHGKREVERMIEETGYMIEERRVVERFGGRERYEIFLLSRGG